MLPLQACPRFGLEAQSFVSYSEILMIRWLKSIFAWNLIK